MSRLVGYKRATRGGVCQQWKEQALRLISLLATDIIEAAVLAAAERQGKAPSERGSTREQNS
ncbi:hypothetical protein FD785_26940 [Klebsiella pneumoniae]|nr:hypothetical protein [Klebsiella pneumoniae]HBZ2116269.1 hypothetical protein [Klebsiella pneumoniae]